MTFRYDDRPISLFSIGLLLTSSLAIAHTEEITPNINELAPIEIHATPLSGEADRFSQPLSILSKKTIQANGDKSSLGALLSNTAGIQESGFTPGASRPIIRGLDGARLRIQRNGISTGDLSSLSPDHAVAEDTILAQQVEVLQGASTLLYGTQAIGGVINIVDDLLPSKQRTYTDGTLQLHTLSADHSFDAATSLVGGTAPINWSIQAFSRHNEDLRTPQGKIPFSDQSSEGFTAGTSWKNSNHHVGVQFSSLKKNYGIAGSEGDRIDLDSQTIQLAGEHREPSESIDRIRWNLGSTRYQHAEIEKTGDVGTTFHNDNTEGRIELTHREGQGAFGVQWQQAKLSAIGTESLITPTQQKQIGLFTVQEKSLGTGTASAGIRYDDVSSDNQGNPDGVSRGETHRHFSLINISTGWTQPLTPYSQWNVNLVAAQRAPEVEALYAEGNHVAQQRYLIGNTELKRERAINLDLGLSSPQRNHDQLEWKVSAFYRRFQDFIYGKTVVDAAGQPILSNQGFITEKMSQQGATFKGLEWSAQWKLPHTEKWSIGTWGDIVSSQLADGTTPPRLAPARLALNAGYQMGSWKAQLEALHRFKPRSLAPNETDTSASTQLDARLEHTHRLNENQRVDIWLEGLNLSNQTIRLHTSYLKEQAPLAGRALHAGLRLKF